MRVRARLTLPVLYLAKLVEPGCSTAVRFARVHSARPMAVSLGMLHPHEVRQSDLGDERFRKK